MNEEGEGLEEKQLVLRDHEEHYYFHSFSLQQLKPNVFLEVTVFLCLVALKERVYRRPTPQVYSCVHQ